MLLSTLQKRLKQTHRFNPIHNPSDFHPLSFELGDTTRRGIEVRATTWKRAKRSGKGYHVAGYFRHKEPSP